MISPKTCSRVAPMETIWLAAVSLPAAGRQATAGCLMPRRSTLQTPACTSATAPPPCAASAGTAAGHELTRSELGRKSCQWHQVDEWLSRTRHLVHRIYSREGFSNNCHFQDRTRFTCWCDMRLGADWSTVIANILSEDVPIQVLVVAEQKAKSRLSHAPAVLGGAVLQ